MYGFQPRNARGKPAQNLADGGLVHSITGMLGMRKRTPEELLAADAKAQARNQEAAAKVAAREQPAASPAGQPSKAITSYAGMTAMQRREKEMGLKDGGTVGGFKPGGLIRGPGTGTSDSIKDKMRPGTFIMPADSTQAVGLDEGEPDADDGAVPVRVSNGEYEMTPEMVQKIGSAVLGVVKDVTHEPVGTARGFTPRKAAPAFANGGAVEPGFGARGLSGLKAMIPKVEAMGYGQSQQAPAAQPVAPPPGSRNVADLKAVIPQMEAMGYKQEVPSARGFSTARNRAEPQEFANGGSVQDPQKRVNSFGDAAAAASDAAVKPIPTQAPAAAPGAAPTGATPSLANDAQAKADRAKLGAVWDTVKDVNDDAGRAILDVATMVPRGLAGAYDSAVVRPMRAAGFNAGYLSQHLTPDGVDPASMTPFTDQKRMAQTATAPASAPNVAPVGGGGGRGSVNPPAVNPGAALPTAQAPSAPLGEAGSAAPRNGGQISTQNMVAASNLARGFEPGRSSQPMENPTRGFAPAGLSAPVVQNSTNNWAARNELRNAAVSASSIENTRRWGGKGAENNPAMQEYRAKLATDQALQQAQPGMDMAALRENGGLQREGVQQAGATARTGLQESGANQRAQGLLGVQQGELDMRRTAQGFQTRAAAQQEQLRATITDPNSSPAARTEAQRALHMLSGRGDSAKDRFLTVGGGQSVKDGQTVKDPTQVYDTQSGQWLTPPGQQGSAPPNGWKQIGTANGKPVYQDSQGNRHIAA